MVLDEISYVQHDRHKLQVPFALLSERYQRRSAILTAKLGREQAKARPRGRAFGLGPRVLLSQQSALLL
jgi:hypothetical protein